MMSNVNKTKMKKTNLFFTLQKILIAEFLLSFFFFQIFYIMKKTTYRLLSGNHRH